MTPAEAVELLWCAARVTERMGMGSVAYEAEVLAVDLELGFLTRRAGDCRRRADYVLPPGRRGRVRLSLMRPEEARATAFVAAVLRAVEDPA